MIKIKRFMLVMMVILLSMIISTACDNKHVAKVQDMTVREITGVVSEQLSKYAEYLPEVESLRDITFSEIDTDLKVGTYRISNLPDSMIEEISKLDYVKLLTNETGDVFVEIIKK